MRTKKITTLCLCAAMIASLSACGGGRSEQTSASTTAASTTPPATLKSEAAEAIAEMGKDAEKLENPTVKFLSSWDLNPRSGKPKQVSLELFETSRGGKIEWVQCTWEERYSALGKLVAAGDSPDMFSASDFDCFPQGVINGMFVPMDDYIDFDSELWAPMTTINDQFVFQGKHYVCAYESVPGCIMVYNKNTIAENGLRDPVELLDEGNWNWDTFREMLIQFNNREEEKFGIDGWWFEGAISQTTGVPYIGMEDGKVVHYLDDSRIQDAQEFMLDLNRQDLPVPKKEYQWQIHPEKIASGKTLFFPIGVWGLTDMGYLPPFTGGEVDENGNAQIGDMENLMFVPMPRCPKADEYYLPSIISGYTICKGAQNPEGVGAYLECVMECRDSEVAKQIEYEQLFEDYKWTEEMYNMLQRTKEMTEEHPVFEFYTAVTPMVNDLINNPMKDCYNHGEPSWAQTKETIRNKVQSELDQVNSKLS